MAKEKMAKEKEKERVKTKEDGPVWCELVGFVVFDCEHKHGTCPVGDWRKRQRQRTGATWNCCTAAVGRWHVGKFLTTGSAPAKERARERERRVERLGETRAKGCNSPIHRGTKFWPQKWDGSSCYKNWRTVVELVVLGPCHVIHPGEPCRIYGTWDAQLWKTGKHISFDLHWDAENVCPHLPCSRGRARDKKPGL